MISKRWKLTFLALALVLCGLAPSGTNAARGAELTQYISPDFCAALVIHPDRISKSTLAEAIKPDLPKTKQSPDSIKAAAAMLASRKGLPPGFDLEKLAKLIEGKSVRRVLILIDPMPAPAVPASVGIIVQFTTDVDGGAIVSAFSSTWQPAEADGTKYVKMKNPTAGQPDFAAVVADSQTLIAGLEVTVVKMLAKDQGEQPLVKQLQRASFKNDILFEFLTEPLFAKLTKATGKSLDESLAAMGNPMLAGFAKDVKSASLKINFSGDTLLHAQVATLKPETANMFAVIAQQGVAGGKQQFEALKKAPPPLVPADFFSSVTKLGDEVFAGLKIKAEETRMEIDLPTPASLPDVLKGAVKMAQQLQQMQQASPTQPPPSAAH